MSSAELTHASQGSPQDGFEYLRRVRWQASTLPDVVTAAGLSQQSFEDQRTAYVPQTPGFQAAPAGAEVRRLLCGWRRAGVLVSDMRCCAGEAGVGGGVRAGVHGAAGGARTMKTVSRRAVHLA